MRYKQTEGEKPSADNLIADEETLAVDLDDVTKAHFPKNRSSKEVCLVLAAGADELLQALVLR